MSQALNHEGKLDAAITSNSKYCGLPQVVTALAKVNLMVVSVATLGLPIFTNAESEHTWASLTEIVYVPAESP